MIKLPSILFSLVLYILFTRALTVSQTYFNDDVMVIEGNSCNSSKIKLMLVDRNVSKIHVYLTHTFYADEDLKLNGITEFQIFADTWHCTQPVTFDLSGSDGASQDPPTVKGSPGSRGIDGKNGGNFFGFANRTINGDYLRVISNGGNGGTGQAGAASDDVYVLLNAENDTGDSGWFSNGDLHNYYHKFFSDRGYDAEIGDIDDYSSLYAVFVHDKIANFNIRLHPRKCCGSTGIGGPGGQGGQRGTFVFKHIRNDGSKSTPTFVGNDGPIGRSGKDGEPCESRALDVSIEVELKKVVFIFAPLHHSFSSKFTVVNHINSSKCSPEYVRSNATTRVKAMKPNELDVVSSTALYKTFLLENMKNESQKSVAQEMYKAIDDDRDINRQNTLKGLLQEAYELEKRFFELKRAMNVTPLYEQLYDRVESKNDRNEDEQRARWRFLLILEFKLNDLEADYNLIVNLELYTEVAISSMEIRTRKFSTMSHLNDVELRDSIDRLQFEVNGKFVLAEYEHVVKGYQLTYFPFAVEYLEEYGMSTSLSDYDNLDDVHLTAVNKINELNDTIWLLKSKNSEIIMNLNYIDYDSATHSLFVWKSPDNRDSIRRLFTGEKITLLADVKQAENQFDAMKFNKIDWYFRSSEQNVTKELNNVLTHFEVELKHDGRSDFQCKNNFYRIITDPFKLSFAFRKDEHGVPFSRLLTYDMLLRNQPTLSPYASWEIQLVTDRKNYMSRLAAFATLPIDIELHGTGKYIWGNAKVCDNKDLAKIYTQI